MSPPLFRCRPLRFDAQAPIFLPFFGIGWFDRCVSVSLMSWRASGTLPSTVQIGQAFRHTDRREGAARPCSSRLVSNARSDSSGSAASSSCFGIAIGWFVANRWNSCGQGTIVSGRLHSRWGQTAPAQGLRFSAWSRARSKVRFRIDNGAWGAARRGWGAGANRFSAAGDSGGGSAGRDDAGARWRRRTSCLQRLQSRPGGLVRYCPG
jgi:hypothetical protein